MFETPLPEITATILKRFSYDQDTGVIALAVNFQGRKAGTPAGNVRDDGYIRMGVSGRDFLAHRVAWLLATGEWPTGQIDHIDGNPSNNKWSNLRDVSPMTNKENQRKAHCQNSTGMLGASFCAAKGKFAAQIFTAGKSIWLGYHDTAEAAHAAYVEAKRLHHQGSTI